MVVEWLQFQVQEDRREQFVQLDNEIWTAMLSQYPGFLRKEVWINPDAPDEVLTVIHWASMEAWQSIPSEELHETEQQFEEQMGADHYELVTSKHYQVRKMVVSPRQ